MPRQYTRSAPAVTPCTATIVTTREWAPAVQPQVPGRRTPTRMRILAMTGTVTRARRAACGAGPSPRGGDRHRRPAQRRTATRRARIAHALGPYGAVLPAVPLGRPRHQGRLPGMPVRARTRPARNAAAVPRHGEFRHGGRTAVTDRSPNRRIPRAGHPPRNKRCSGRLRFPRPTRGRRRCPCRRPGHSKRGARRGNPRRNPTRLRRQ